MEVKSFDYASLKVNHLEETVIIDNDNSIILRTTLVLLPQKMTTEENDYLLIYTIIDQKGANEFLITAFPITASAYQKIINPDELGQKRPIVLRYNAYWPGLMDKKLTGSRVVY